MFKKAETKYFNHCDDNSQVYPTLIVTVCNLEDHVFSNRLFVELENNRHMTKKNAIKYFKWVVSQLEEFSD